MHCSSCGAELTDEARFCSKCGATAGTAAPTSPPKKKMSGCVIALLIGAALVALSVPVIGIIAAIAVPNLLNAIDRGKQKRTMADIRSIALGIENYAVDHDVYPTATDMDELSRLLSPDYIRHVPERDGWANPIRAASSPVEYLLISGGKDGVLDGCHGGPTQDFDDDICYGGGEFIQWPAGIQH